MELSVAKVAANGHVLAGPEGLRKHTGDALGPMSHRADGSARLIFVDFKKAALIVVGPVRQSFLVDISGQDVSNAPNLSWLDSHLNRGRPNTVPIAVIKHCRGSVPIEDGVNARWQAKYHLEQLPSVDSVGDRAVHEGAQLVAHRWPVRCVE